MTAHDSDNSDLAIRIYTDILQNRGGILTSLLGRLIFILSSHRSERQII